MYINYNTNYQYNNFNNYNFMNKIKQLFKKFTGTTYLLFLFAISGLVLWFFPETDIEGDILLVCILLTIVLGGSYFFNKINLK